MNSERLAERLLHKVAEENEQLRAEVERLTRENAELTTQGEP